jgi:tetratricopeptide (TPR) repeat protein
MDEKAQSPANSPVLTLIESARGVVEAGGQLGTPQVQRNKLNGLLGDLASMDNQTLRDNVDCTDRIVPGMADFAYPFVRACAASGDFDSVDRLLSRISQEPFYPTERQKALEESVRMAPAALTAGRYEAARNLYSRAETLNSEYPEEYTAQSVGGLYMNAGKYLLEAGEKKMGREFLDKALEKLDPQSPTARQIAKLIKDSAASPRLQGGLGRLKEKGRLFLKTAGQKIGSFFGASKTEAPAQD